MKVAAVLYDAMKVNSSSGNGGDNEQVQNIHTRI